MPQETDSAIAASVEQPDLAAAASSRYYVDARVLSIFEGADEMFALKVIARRLAQ